MNSIYAELSRALQGAPTRRMGERLGVSESQAQSGIEVGQPLLLSALANNTRRRGGTSALARALDSKPDGSILEDLDGVADGRYDEDGSAILGHVLGADRGNMEGRVAQFAGLDKGTMAKLLVTLAPVILGWLGKMKKGGGGGGGLGDILRREDKGNRRGGGGLGDILGDVLSGSGPGQRQMPGCLGLLGGLLGGKR